MTDELTIDQYLNLENPHAEFTQKLYEWSLNCSPTNNPFSEFLNLIGWADEMYGTKFGQAESLGYLELDLLGEALIEYTISPNDVKTWITELNSCLEG
jgi:hypothetical protein